MAASPHLSQKIRDLFGNEAGQELIGILDKMASDVSDVRGDVAELRHQMDMGFGRVDGKFEAMSKVIEQELRKQTQFFFLAWAVILAAIVGLYSR